MKKFKYNFGGNVQQPQDFEEFKEFLAEMVQGGQIEESDITEQNVPKLYSSFQDLKKSGKWRSKKNKSFSYMGSPKKAKKAMFKNGGLNNTSHQLLYQVNGSTGEIEMVIEPGARIFSIPHTEELLKKVKKAKKEEDYLEIAKTLEKIIEIHKTQKPEYTED